MTSHELPEWTPKGEKIISKIEDVTGPNGHAPLRLKDEIRQDILGELGDRGVDPNLLGRVSIGFLERDKRPQNLRMLGNKDIDAVRIKIQEIFGPAVLKSLNLSLRD
jgi:hypothetical protein